MLLRRSPVVALAALVVSACAIVPVSAASLAADPFVTASAADPRFNPERLSDHIKYLASDELEGRFPGLIGERLTLAYLQAQYEAMGLEPGGRDGSWLQPVDLVRFTPERAPTAAWVGADGVSHPLISGQDITLRAGPADPTVRIESAPLFFAGYGIVAPERGWDDYGDGDLTGRVVVILRGQPESMGADPNFYGSTTHKTQEALKRGAEGVITLQDDAGRWRRAVGGAERPRMAVKGAQDVRFDGSINAAAATAIGGAALDDAVARAKAAALGGALDLGARLTLDIAETTDVIHSNNLLAKIPGAARPDEYVVYSAHWDHIGKTREPNVDGDDIYNGAWDNASGTAGLIEMARAFKAGPAPERTVVFLHVTAEEQGLLGSEAYAADPVYPLARTAADINIDMLPFTPATRDVAVFGVGKSELEDILDRFARVQGRTVTGEGYPQEGFYYRSDHFNFAAGGTPALMPWTGRDFIEGGLEAGTAYYEGQMEGHYHKLTDEWRADYDFTAALQNLDLLYRLGLTVANSETWPAWKPTAEFNAIRDATADQRR